VHLLVYVVVILGPFLSTSFNDYDDSGDNCYRYYLHYYYFSKELLHLLPDIKLVCVSPKQREISVT
jgi:hypothetical protein